MTLPQLLLGAAALLLLATAISFNRFVSQRNYVRDAWSGVQTELQRRYDLVPNLVEVVKGYAAHEASVLQAVTAARARAAANHGPPADQSRDEAALVGGLRSLLAVSEDYPDLKASANFLDLQRQLVTTEDRIQAARRLYNSNVRDLNRRVESIPSSLVATLFGFERADYFELDPAIGAAPPDASF